MEYFTMGNFHLGIFLMGKFHLGIFLSPVKNLVAIFREVFVNLKKIQ